MTTTFLTTDNTTIAPPPAFHIMIKPRGAICNLDCKYCYFLAKEMMYPGSRFRMADELLEDYTRQYIAAQQVPEVTFGWQGGEPTLMGLDFFRRAVALQQKYCKPGMRIYNAFQTNGTLLDDDWCRFFKQHDFLVGLSIDGHTYFSPTTYQVFSGLLAVVLLLPGAVMFGLGASALSRRAHGDADADADAFADEALPAPQQALIIPFPRRVLTDG